MAASCEAISADVFSFSSEISRKKLDVVLAKQPATSGTRQSTAGENLWDVPESGVVGLNGADQRLAGLAQGLGFCGLRVQRFTLRFLRRAL